MKTVSRNEGKSKKGKERRVEAIPTRKGSGEKVDFVWFVISDQR
jgi:hypothetical protein